MRFYFVKWNTINIKRKVLCRTFPVVYSESCKGPSIKDVRTKSWKIDPLPPRPKNIRTGSYPPRLYGPTDRKLRKIAVFAPKSADIRTEDWRTLPPCPKWTTLTFPLTAGSFMDSPSCNTRKTFPCIMNQMIYFVKIRTATDWMQRKLV